MTKPITVAATAVVVGILATGLLLYSQSLFFAGDQSTPPAALTVGATIFPLADIARAIGGDEVEVLLILPPGVSEHSTALSPQQLRGLERAPVIFHIGHNLDDRLTERITTALPATRTVTVDAGIVLREFSQEEEHHHDSGIDPHYWLTVPNASHIAATITATLQDLDPTHAAVYTTNLARYQQQLASLEQELQAAARTAPRKEFIATHNAWSYLADHYGFDVVATYEPTTGQEPSLADLGELQEVVNRFGLTTFYAEPQKSSTAATRLLQREFGLNIRELDPVGGLPGTDSYLELMRTNMAALVTGGS